MVLEKKKSGIDKVKEEYEAVYRFKIQEFRWKQWQNENVRDMQEFRSFSSINLQDFSSDEKGISISNLIQIKRDAQSVILNRTINNDRD